MAAAAPGRAGFYIQPYLQNVHPTAVTVQWWMDGGDGPGQVEFGPGLSRVVPASHQRVASVGRVLYRAVLTGLDPETSYPYRVRSQGAVSDSYEFSTAVRRSGPFRVAVFGDGRTDHASFTDLAVRPRGCGRWEAALQFVRDDGQAFDPIRLQRADPLVVEP